jgi:hypothetical protein
MNNGGGGGGRRQCGRGRNACDNARGRRWRVPMCGVVVVVLQHRQRADLRKRTLTRTHVCLHVTAVQVQVTTYLVIRLSLWSELLFPPRREILSVVPCARRRYRGILLKHPLLHGHVGARLGFRRRAPSVNHRGIRKLRLGPGMICLRIDAPGGGAAPRCLLLLQPRSRGPGSTKGFKKLGSKGFKKFWPCQKVEKHRFPIKQARRRNFRLLTSSNPLRQNLKWFEVLPHRRSPHWQSARTSVEEPMHGERGLEHLSAQAPEERMQGGPAPAPK